MASKSLTVLDNDGAGKKTLLGSLIYKCGLELPQLEELERRGMNQMADIVPFYEEIGRTLSFETPSGPLVVEKIPKPDVVFWLADATDLASWTSPA